MLNSKGDLAPSLASINPDGQFSFSGSWDGELHLRQKMEAFALFLFPLNPPFRSSPRKNCLPLLRPLGLVKGLILGSDIFWGCSESVGEGEMAEFANQGKVMDRCTFWRLIHSKPKQDGSGTLPINDEAEKIFLELDKLEQRERLNGRELTTVL
ncbi:uncharacterized protein LOC133718342 [Rosa rugosa]|uniref:uncharacterized protein LOC133712678 n=1 Tax=Rosa rugosa TaxID=74645 RepID=UPI002B40F584|nr:uncharacterized protein LOC133712678 [Rosa rugosa]XP_062001151.1 uncharacterized protein LOC133718342 [Rosa rugosa]